MARMPSSKLKPSDIASEAKRAYIPYCASRYSQFKPNSILIPQARELRPESVDSAGSTGSHTRVAVIEGDPVDVALEWYEHEKTAPSSSKGSKAASSDAEFRPIPVVNAANERRPGGDWELGLVAAEENLCRRSNLVACLVTQWPGATRPNYPIPQYGGIYSPSVVVFRDGHERGYGLFPNFKPIPVISVAPARRPKVDESGDRYSFSAEADHVRNKMKTILRIASDQRHRRLVIGSWGLGNVYRNPARQMAQMWADLLFRNEEFVNKFTEIVFVIEPCSIANAGSAGERDSAPHHLKVFKEELDPSNIYPAGHKFRYHR